MNRDPGPLASPQIRAATEADLPAILALYAEAVDDGAQLDPAAAREIFARMHAYPDYTLFVAEAEGEIVGTYALLIMDNLAHLGARSGVAEDVVVRADWRGRGIGRAMMQHAVERCRRAACYKLALSSNLKREQAHRFYDSIGFERHGYSFRVLLDEEDT